MTDTEKSCIDVISYWRHFDGIFLVLNEWPTTVRIASPKSGWIAKTGPRLTVRSGGNTKIKVKPHQKFNRVTLINVTSIRHQTFNPEVSPQNSLALFLQSIRECAYMGVWVSMWACVSLYLYVDVCECGCVYVSLYLGVIFSGCALTIGVGTSQRKSVHVCGWCSTEHVDCTCW